MPCSSMTSVSIGDGVLSIGECAFLGCTDLMSVTHGNNIRSIGNRAFECCNDLISMHMRSSDIALHVENPDEQTVKQEFKHGVVQHFKQHNNNRGEQRIEQRVEQRVEQRIEQTFNYWDTQPLEQYDDYPSNQLTDIMNMVSCI